MDDETPHLGGSLPGGYNLRNKSKSNLPVRASAQESVIRFSIVLTRKVEFQGNN